MHFSTYIIWDLIEYGKIRGADLSVLTDNFSTLRTQKYVGYETVVKVINHLYEELEDHCLGLHVGERISLKATAYVDNIMLQSKTLEESINNAIAYSKLISDALECSLDITERYYSVIYQENPNWKVHQTFAKQQILDMALISNVKSLANYTNQNYFPVCVNFSYERPKNIREYYRLFNCRLRFSQTKTEIVFERYIIDKHIRKIEYGLLENLKNKVTNEIKNLEGEDNLICELKKCILKQKPQRITVKQASSQLNLSRRTLQRRLKDLNTSFKKVEYQLQLRLAKTYLGEKQRSIDEISYLLGFSESSAFIRFFKSITSKTPIEYRNNVG